MSEQLDFNAAYWTRPEALYWIFFSATKAQRLDRRQRSEAIRAIRYFFNQVDHGLGDEPHQQNDAIGKKLIRLTKMFPVIRDVQKAQPLLWIRFAFSALLGKIRPTGFFFKLYSRWRLERSLTHPGETVISSVDLLMPESQQPCVRIKNQRFPGYPFDRFFLETAIDAELDSDLEWRLIENRIDCSKKSGKRDINSQVGAPAFQLITNLVEDAAKHKKIRGLLKTKIGERYKCEISRDDLIEALIDEYRDELCYRESTIKKALTKLVACPGYRVIWSG